MVRKHLETNVFDAALDRLVKLYEDPANRIVVSFSAGKDSTCVLELARMAAQITGNGPVDVMLRDEEIMFPGTYEYAEEIAREPDIRMHWLISNQPIVNIYNRRQPYWWVFDPLVDPGDWVRQPPAFAKTLPTMAIETLVSLDRFPTGEGGRLYSLLGLRAQESSKRRMGIQSSGSYITRHPTKAGAYIVRPIYDWVDGDVWLAIKRYGWNYNSAYDVMHRLGIKREFLRIAPPTMTTSGVGALAASAKAWPGWFERVANRCPGVRQVALFGLRVVQPQRRAGETWRQCYERECITDAPAWVADRARKVRDAFIARHRRHSPEPFPEEKPCYACGGGSACWRKLTFVTWAGDPFALKTPDMLDAIEPEFFRPQLVGTTAGKWGGKPNW